MVYGFDDMGFDTSQCIHIACITEPISLNKMSNVECQTISIYILFICPFPSIDG